MIEPRQSSGSAAVRPKRTLYLAALLSAVCVAASALAAQETESSLWGTMLVAAVGSGSAGAVLTGLLMIRVQRRATNASADKLEVEALDTSVNTVQRLLEEVGKLHAEVTTAKDAARASERQVEELQSEVRQLREQFAAAVHGLSAERIAELTDFAEMWNLPHVSVPVVFTSAVNGGRFDMVNDAFCRLVGREREDLLGTGWARYVVDADATRKEEAAAHRRRVWGFRNEWRLPDGGTQWVEWFAAPYKAKRTMAFAFPVTEAAAIAHPQAPRLRIAETR